MDQPRTLFGLNLPIQATSDVYFEQYLYEKTTEAGTKLES